MIIQIKSIEMSDQESTKLAPSKAILRIALLKCVNGSILQNGCIHAGKLSMEKKVPANKNCGSVITLAKGGIVLSFFAIPLTINPKPINNIKATKLNAIILKNVKMPFTNVN